MIKRRYGNVRTHLSLSGKAEDLYSGSDPFEIYEYEDEDGNFTYTYRAWGNPETKHMTEDELNADLEALADAMDDEEDE